LSSIDKQQYQQFYHWKAAKGMGGDKRKTRVKND